jgi:glycosyltransferase involved in cell wall biosynthesis
MNVAVFHHSLNPAGGAERLCLAAIEALKTHGHHVSLVTVERTNWAFLQNKFGKTTMPDREIYVTSQLVSQRLKRMPVASAYFMAYAMQLLFGRSKIKYDLTLNTFGDVIDSAADITYIHFPLRSALEFSQVPAFTRTSTWQRLAPMYNLAVSACDKIAPSRLLVANSKFIQGIIRTTLSRDVIVIYPPVDTAVFSSKCFKAQKEGNLVVVVASYTPKRHLEQLPQIAEQTEAAKFIVIGKTDEYSMPTIQRLEENIRVLHVKDKITLLKNVSFTELQRVLAEAKVYLHMMPFDHFGISVVEAMASGCVPVVHRSGGPWTDILDRSQGEYGFSYSTPCEAADYIDRLVTNEELRSRIAAKASYRSKKFDRSVFMRRLVEVVERVAG